VLSLFILLKFSRVDALSQVVCVRGRVTPYSSTKNTGELLSNFEIWMLDECFPLVVFVGKKRTNEAKEKTSDFVVPHCRCCYIASSERERESWVSVFCLIGDSLFQIAHTHTQNL
jgi:hypothetical protein